METPAGTDWGKWLGAIFHRPAVVALVCLIVGIVTADWLPGFLSLYAIIPIAVVAFLCQWIPLPSGVRWAPVLLLILLVGAWRTDQKRFQIDDSRIAVLEEQALPVTVRGTVDRDPVESSKGTLVLLDDVTQVEGDQESALSGKFYLTAPKAADMHYGDRVEVWGRISRPSGRRNPGGVDWASAYHRQGVVGRLTPFSEEDITVIGTGGKPWLETQVAYPLRSLIKRQIQKWIPERSQALVSAMTVGEWEQLDPEFTMAARRSGTAHLVVISGFNVGIIALLLLRFFWLMRMPYPMQIALALVGISLYAMITEMNPPVLRAVIMAAILGGSFLLHRQWDSWNTLAAAAFFILLLRPGDLQDPSFQLSFAAVGSIVFFYPSFHRFLVEYRWFHRARSIWLIGGWLYGALVVAVCAQIGTIPIVAAQFGRVPTLGIIATILGAPLVILIVPFSLIVIILGALGIPMAGWLGISLDYLAVLFQYLTKTVSNLSFSSLEVKNVNYLIVVGCILIGYMLWHFRQRWAKWGVAICIVLLGSAVVWSSNVANLDSICEVSFLDVGQGACSLVRFNGGRSLLIDGGPVKEE
jgi:competence protein ComEC